MFVRTYQPRELDQHLLDKSTNIQCRTFSSSRIQANELPCALCDIDHFRYSMILESLKY